MRRVRIPVGGGWWIGLGRSSAFTEAAASLEPSSTLVAAGLRSSMGMRVRLSVEDVEGRVSGAVVLHRLGPAQWDALPLVIDHRSLDLLTRLIDWSPATAVLGIDQHVAPLVDRLRRARTVGRSTFYGHPFIYDETPAGLDLRTRSASLGDVPALADLFASSYPLSRPPDVASWRRALRQHITEGFVVVAEVEGEIVAGFDCGVASEKWVFLVDGVVREDHRGTGLAWAATQRMVAVANLHGLMFCGAIIDENPMNVAHHVPERQEPTGELWGVALDPHLGARSVRWRRRQARRARRWSAPLVDAAGSTAERVRSRLPAAKR